MKRSFLRTGHCWAREVFEHDWNVQDLFVFHLQCSYYRAALGAMVIFSVGDRSSFQALPTWLNNLEMKSTDPNLVTFVVGNKSDLEGTDRVVTRDEAKRFCDQRNLYYAETSALNNENVTETFDLIVDKIWQQFQKPNNVDTAVKTSSSAPVVLTEGNSPPSNGCCK